MSTPRILVIGHSGAGKTLVGDILAEMNDTTCANTSDVLMEEYADACGVPVGELAEDKDVHRAALYAFANEHPDPAHLVKVSLERGAIVTGVRRRIEFAACRAMFDLCVWKDSPHVTADATDGLTREHADLVIPWCNDAGAELGEAVGEALEVLRIPEVYVVGRYRHWTLTGEWDWARMDAMADEEAAVAETLRAAGLRTFCPIRTHAPLDEFWGKDSAKRILELCREKLLRMRHRDAICVRHGWQDVPGLPDSAGTEMEIGTAVQQGLGVLYTQHGDDALWRACEMLLSGT